MTYFDNKNIFVNEFNILLHMDLLLLLVLLKIELVEVNHFLFY